MLRSGDVRIIGTYFLGKKEVLLKYHTIYHEILQELHKKNIADDDQAVMIQVAQKYPEIYKMHFNDLSHPSGWFRAFHLFGENTSTSNTVSSNELEKIVFNDRKDFKKFWENYDGIFVEVGVYKGEFSMWAINETNFTKMYGVDPYKKFDNSEFMDAINDNSQEFFDYLYSHTNTLFAGIAKYKLLRKTSVEASKTFQDNSIDVVYVDGNHMYKNVMEDILLWWDKIRVGGMLCGDDCCDKLDQPYDKDGNQKIVWGVATCWGYYGVNKALFDFETRTGVKVVRLKNNQWYILKQ